MCVCVYWSYFRFCSVFWQKTLMFIYLTKRRAKIGLVELQSFKWTEEKFPNPLKLKPTPKSAPFVQHSFKVVPPPRSLIQITGKEWNQRGGWPDCLQDFLMIPRAHLCCSVGGWHGRANRVVAGLLWWRVWADRLMNWAEGEFNFRRVTHPLTAD